MRAAAIIATLASLAGWAWIAGMLYRPPRRARHARGEGYVDGVLDRDRDLRPDAGTGGAQPIGDDR